MRPTSYGEWPWLACQPPEGLPMHLTPGTAPLQRKHSMGRRLRTWTGCTAPPSPCSPSPTFSSVRSAPASEREGAMSGIVSPDTADGQRRRTALRYPSLPMPKYVRDGACSERINDAVSALEGFSHSSSPRPKSWPSPTSRHCLCSARDAERHQGGGRGTGRGGCCASGR